MATLVALVALVALVPFGGCRLAIDVDDPMCVSDSDCAQVGDHSICGSAGVCVTPATADGSDGASSGGDYGNRSLQEWRERYPCLFDDPLEGESTAANSGDYSMAGERVQVTMTITDYSTNEVPPDLKLEACAILDVECESPIVADIYPDIFLGLVIFELPHGFSGYLNISAKDYLRVRWSSSAPLLEDIYVEGPALLKQELLALLAMQSDERYDPATGMLVVDMLDCDGEPAEGVVLRRSSDLNERPFYFATSLADSSLPASEISTSIGGQSTPRSIGGFLNLPPGSETIRATLLGTDIPFASDTVLMKASTVTYLRLYAGAAK